MVVPYIRSPRRLRNQLIAIKTKSQYHLEPDHANTYDPSTYKHVGSRTKGGGGGGYLLSSGNSSTNGGDEEPNPFLFWMFAGVFGLSIICVIITSIWKICRILCKCLCRRNQEYQQEQRQTEDFPHREQTRQRRELEAFDAGIGRPTPPAPRITDVHASYFLRSSFHPSAPEDMDSKAIQQSIERKQLI